jgi:hypothetical protein
MSVWRTALLRSRKRRLMKIRQIKNVMPSSVVARFNYDKDTNTLTVVFVSGMVYDYLEVPEEVYNEMKSSGSKGTYLNLHIKGHYDYKKVG